MALGYNLPSSRTYEDTIRFLMWEQFPAIMQTQIEYGEVLPQIGVYSPQVNPNIVPFKEKLLTDTGRQFTIAGVGSLFDFDKFGHQIKRPTPQSAGTGCNGNSLCLEPTCFGFVEGVIESNNVLQDMCWELSMPCLKDSFYSDARFEDKMNAYFRMFFAQGPAVLQAYLRTRLLREAIKIVATDENFQYTGSVIGGDDGISLPFYINPADATAFPDLDSIPADVGGFNMVAFANFLAPKLFSMGAFAGNVAMNGVRVYGLKSDYQVAKEQTAGVVDNYMTRQIIEAIQLRGGSTGADKIDGLFNFTEDGLFPTFKANSTTNVLELIPAEVLEPSTIYGWIQTYNPEHTLAQYRGLLFVPPNWRFDLVSPPKDDFSDLGLAGLNFGANTPGVSKVLSSSLFTSSRIGPDKRVVLGLRTDANGFTVPQANGLQARDRNIDEAIRTDLLLTYSKRECGQTTDDQLQQLGPRQVAQSRADGFALKSTMYVGSAVKGQARPVLVIFKTDTPRSASPIKVCTVNEVTIETNTQPLGIIGCTPGDATYAVLTFNAAVGSAYAVNDLAILRTGRGDTYRVKVTVVSGAVVTVIAVDSAGAADTAIILPCCSGIPDDYGYRGELTKTTGATVKTSEVMKAEYSAGTMLVELFTPTAAALINASGTLTLLNGGSIEVKASIAKPVGVFITLDEDSGETASLADLDCSCLVGATLTMD